jgi:energy-coupling factor transporter ATP-binding protein EcfA2
MSALIDHPKCMGTPSERKLKLRELFIDRPITDTIFQDIDEARANRHLHPEPTSVLIIGDTGFGKSTLLTHYCRAHPLERVNGILCRPVLMVELEVKANMLSAAAEMLRALGDPGAERGTLSGRGNRVRTQLELQKVEVILIDEFHHIVEASGERTLNKVGDWLKQLSKRTGIPLVLAGLPHSASLLDINKQFAGICPYRRNLNPFDWRNADSRRDYRLFLARVDAALPFDDWSGLAEPDTARRLFIASSERGYAIPRPLMVQIRSAGGRAIDRGACRIEMQDLEEAFAQEIAPTSPLTYNPFSGAPSEIGKCPPSHNRADVKSKANARAYRTANRLNEILTTG